MPNKLVKLLFIILPLIISCSSTKDQITSGTKYQIFKDSLLNKHYYIYDSIRLYVIMPEELVNQNPEHLFEDSKGTPFVSLGEELYEIDIDTTNSLYTGFAAAAVSDSLKTKQSAEKKLSKAKSKKKPRTTKKQNNAVKKKK